MKLLIVFVGLVAYAACADNVCYNEVQAECGIGGIADSEPHCYAKYGGMHSVAGDLQKYANTHITRSFEYLLMSTHFGTYQKSREGFEKLYRKLSDSSWDDAIDIIKYITKRGEVMKFDNRKENAKVTPITTYEVSELASLALVLDRQKSIAEEAHRIHGEVIRKKEQYHDPEVSSFIENHFVHKHADSIRSLAGHTNDLKSLLKNSAQPSLSVFLFDEYLQKL